MITPYDSNGKAGQTFTTVWDPGRIVPEGMYQGNWSGGTDHFAVPNAFGFYPYTEEPREGAGFISVKDLEGNWIHGQFELTISNCDRLSGTFEDCDESGSAAGTVKLEFTLDENNAQQLWYNLYSADGKLYRSFRATGDIPLNELRSEFDGSPYSRRPV